MLSGAGMVVRTLRRRRSPAMWRSRITRATRLWFTGASGGTGVGTSVGTAVLSLASSGPAVVFSGEVGSLSSAVTRGAP